MRQVEVEEMAFLLHVIQVARIIGESVSRGDVMVEDDDLVGDIDELVELGARRSDVDECDERVFAIRKSDPVFMTAGDVPGIIAPSVANGPSRAEAIGAA